MYVLFYHAPSARSVIERELNLVEGFRLSDAIMSLAQSDSALFLTPESIRTNKQMLKEGYSIAVWSKPAQMEQLLQPGDRVEVLRPIKVDPKVARRERFKKQGVKAAGLFAKKRPGAKAGY
jgi:putative ubiquitin-RnfH superfamily antitoxin RatB of RatAB toxin-antitoxin module